MQPRPAQVTIAGVVLILVTAFTLLFGALGVIGYFGSFQGEGAATPSTRDFVVGAVVQVTLPLVVALIAGAAALGVLRGRQWGRMLSIVIGAAFVIGGITLMWTAISEWGLPGSFSVLVLPPAVMALLVGGILVWAMATSGEYFTDR